MLLVQAAKVGGWMRVEAEEGGVRTGWILSMFPRLYALGLDTEEGGRPPCYPEPTPRCPSASWWGKERPGPA